MNSNDLVERAPEREPCRRKFQVIVKSESASVRNIRGSASIHSSLFRRNVVGEKAEKTRGLSPTRAGVQATGPHDLRVRHLWYILSAAVASRGSENKCGPSRLNYTYSSGMTVPRGGSESPVL